CRGCARIDCLKGLRAAPIVEHRDLMNARDGAVRGARFFRVELTMAPLGRVLRERDAGVAALLRAIMNEAVLAYIQVARTGSTAPVVFPPRGDIVLKRIHT